SPGNRWRSVVPNPRSRDPSVSVRPSTTTRTGPSDTSCQGSAVPGHIVFLECYPHVRGGPQATTSALATGLSARGWTREVVALTRSSFGAPNPRIVTAGRRHPVKGFDVAIDAVAMLRPRLPGLSLDIYGDPQVGHEAHARELDARVRRLALEETVRFHTHRPC